MPQTTKITTIGFNFFRFIPPTHFALAPASEPPITFNEKNNKVITNLLNTFPDGAGIFQQDSAS